MRPESSTSSFHYDPGLESLSQEMGNCRSMSNPAAGYRPDSEVSKRVVSDEGDSKRFQDALREVEENQRQAKVERGILPDQKLRVRPRLLQKDQDGLLEKDKPRILVYVFRVSCGLALH